MKMTYDKKTGVANDIAVKDLAMTYREAIEKITTYLSLELFKYNRIVTKEIPNDVIQEADDYIDSVRADFIDKQLMYYMREDYINPIDCRKIYKSFHETIAQLEDIYLYRTIYRKSRFHCDWIWWRIQRTGVKTSVLFVYCTIKF